MERLAEALGWVVCAAGGCGECGERVWDGVQGAIDGVLVWMHRRCADARLERRTLWMRYGVGIVSLSRRCGDGI